MSSNRTNGTKPAIQHTKSILDDRRIRLLLAIVGAIVAWMVVTIVVQPGTTAPSTTCRWILPMIPPRTPPGA